MLFPLLLITAATVCLSFRPSVRTGQAIVHNRFLLSTTRDRFDSKLKAEGDDELEDLPEGQGMCSKGKNSDPTIDTGVLFNANLIAEEYTDEQYEEFLEAMIYGGDITGFIQRRAKEVVSEDFIDFLDYKLV